MPHSSKPRTFTDAMADVDPLKADLRHKKVGAVETPAWSPLGQSAAEDDVEAFDFIPPPPPVQDPYGAAVEKTFQSLPKWEPDQAPPLKGTDEPFTVYQETDVCFHAARSSVDEKTRRKLAKGEFPLERRLDLHGFVFDEAWNGLADFLRAAYMGNARAVLVIHGKGKGYGEGGQMGLIKSHICTWLRSSPFVLAYHTAQAKHGGGGAVYVLLRRVKA